MQSHTSAAPPHPERSERKRSPPMSSRAERAQASGVEGSPSRRRPALGRDPVGTPRAANAGRRPRPRVPSGAGAGVRTVFRLLGWPRPAAEPNENGIWFAGMDRRREPSQQTEYRSQTVRETISPSQQTEYRSQTPTLRDRLCLRRQPVHQTVPLTTKNAQKQLVVVAGGTVWPGDCRRRHSSMLALLLRANSRQFSARRRPAQRLSAGQPSRTGGDARAVGAPHFWRPRSSSNGTWATRPPPKHASPS